VLSLFPLVRRAIGVRLEREVEFAALGNLRSKDFVELETIGVMSTLVATEQPRRERKKVEMRFANMKRIAHDPAVSGRAIP
jgi:hypothetical protein